MIHRLDIPRDADAPRFARRAMAACAIDDDLREDAAVLVSELVTNSVRHGDGPTIRVIFETDEGGTLRCEVIDQGAGFVPEARCPDREDPGGWGLTLVQALSCSWGVRQGRTNVWFELKR